MIAKFFSLFTILFSILSSIFISCLAFGETQKIPDTQAQTSDNNSDIKTDTHNDQTAPAPSAPPTQNVAPPSSIEIEYQNEKNLFLPRFKNYIALFKPSYILPYYYTTKPYYSVYDGTIPNNQTLKHSEFKAQLSVYIPLVKNLFYNKNVSINIAYTQLLYWQLYTNSPWFRETNYEPNIALRYRFMRNTFGELSLDHQSNGRGGHLERSWNRLIMTFEFSTADFFAQINGWVLLFKGGTTNKDNPQIAYYLGYDKIILSYRFFKKFVVSAEANNIESAYTRGFFMFTGFYPLSSKVGVYLQYFNGYGQSLIEYNHKTQGFGVGFALNDWQ